MLGLGLGISSNPVLRGGGLHFGLDATAEHIRAVINDPTAYGESLGPELVSNGTFDANIVGWAAQFTSTAAWQSGALRSISSGTNAGEASQAITCVVGRTYEVIGTVAGGTSSGRITVSTLTYGGTGSSYVTSGSVSFRFVASATTMYVVCGNSNGTINFYCDYDNISVREVVTGYLLLGLGGARLNASARSSVAMQQKSDGTYEYAAHNLFVRSEEFDDASWLKGSNGTASLPVVTANYGASPIGAITADRVVLALNGGTTTNDRSNVQQNISPATPGTLSVWARSNTTATFQVQLRAGNADTVMVVTPVWQRFSVSTVGSGDPTAWFSLRGSQGTSDSCDILVWGAQLNLGPTATPYVPTTTAAVYAPAVDWLSAQSAYGLRSEAAATNWVTYSTQLDNADWGKGDTTVSANQGIAPDGTTTADLLYPTTTGSSRYVWRPVSLFTAAAQAITASWYVKASSWTWVMLNVEGSSSGVWFNISAGTVGTASAGYSGTITSIGSGWYRITATNTRTGAVHPTLRVCDGDNTLTATASSTNGVLLWGAQLETGSRASSPILTLAATATRAADALVVPDSGWINQTEGTLAVNAIWSGGSALSANSRQAAALENGTSTDRLRIYNINGTAGGIYSTTGGVEQVGGINGTPATDLLVRSAVRYGLNDFALATDGVFRGTDTSATVPSLNRLSLGAHANGGELNGHISRIRYVGRRLTNAQLQALTA